MGRTMKKRIGIIALLQENNTFIRARTMIQHFKDVLLVEGSDVVQRFAGSQHEMGGFIASTSNDPSIEIVGVFAARAAPYGTIASECWDTLMQRLVAALDRYGPYDGLLVAPHGANVAENALDADGDWLSRVRHQVGHSIPIIGTLDLHANVSQAMVNATDALFGYRTNPHLDQRECGLLAGNVMLQTLSGKCAPVHSLVQIPLCPNIERQATSEPQGCSLFQHADRVAKLHPGVVSISCLYGFPYADVPEMGASVIAVTNGNRELANQCADEVAKHWWEHREEFVGKLTSIESAIDLAQQVLSTRPGKPIGLLDMGDNVGGGSPGDATAIVHAWIQRSNGSILTVIADREAVQLAAQVGIGGKLHIGVGGKQDPVLHGEAIVDTYTVQSLSNGRFREEGVTHGGYQDFDQGPTAVLVGTQGQTIIATTLRVGPMSIQQVLSQGVDPSLFDAVVIKGVHAPVAAYAPICQQLIRVNTDGVTTADQSQLDYRNRRRPLFPLERDADYAKASPFKI
jgi:microcystin degradation protein MlrC